jgi:hypothetical protein
MVQGILLRIACGFMRMSDFVSRLELERHETTLLEPLPIGYENCCYNSYANWFTEGR